MTFFCFSQARSGHHAVMNWMRSHLSPVEWGEWKGVKTVQFPALGYVQGAKVLRTTGLDQITIRRLEREKQNFSHVFLNCENQWLLLDFDKVKIPHEQICSVLILRDPFNNITNIAHAQRAALLSKNYGERLHGKQGASSPKFGIKLWKEYAEEFLGTTNKLINKVCINFNLWFSSQEYRDSISRQIGGKPDVKMLNYVAPQGGGSTYDKFDFQDKAQEMDLLERWKLADKKPKGYLMMKLLIWREKYLAKILLIR